MRAQHYWLVTAWDERLSSWKSCQLAICRSTIFPVSRYLGLMPEALIIERQIPLQFEALGASNSHFSYSPGQSMTELGRGGREIQWGCLTNGKEIDQITRHGYWRHESERSGGEWKALIGLQPHEWQWNGKKVGGRLEITTLRKVWKIEPFSDVSWNEVHQRLACRIKFIRGMPTGSRFTGKMQVRLLSKVNTQRLVWTLVQIFSSWKSKITEPYKATGLLSFSTCCMMWMWSSAG